jgi:ParB/RepB/Spo0J family partition protein
MHLEFHQLERRLEHLRVRRPDRQRRLLASLAASGQQTPIVVVASEQPDRYLVIDGYRRVAALKQLGRDTVEAVVWSISETLALLLDRTMRWSKRETALEEGWLLAELEQCVRYGLEELARRFDRSTSWVSRRLALVELLPESVQQQVRDGAIAAHVAMKFLVPAGPVPSGKLPASGRGDSKTPLEQPRSGAVICSLADSIGCRSREAFGRTAVVSEDATAA